jgi:hypothetical protein
VIRRTASGTDAVIDTFAVALNHGVEGLLTTHTLTSLLQRAGPDVLGEAESKKNLELDPWESGAATVRTHTNHR